MLHNIISTNQKKLFETPFFITNKNLSITLKNYLKLMRTHQYIKNVLIFAPIFFFPDINDVASIAKVGLAFIFFSLTSSAVYILNDYFDREDDARHPTKKNRPLASGAVSPKQGITLFSILIGAAFIGSFLFLPLSATLIIIFYFVLNIAYSIRLKQIPILDICIIALGFVIRLFVGGEIIEVNLSSWIVMMTFLLALFLAVAKRRDDVLIMEKTGRTMRKSISGYNLQFVNSVIIMLATMVLVSYIMYTVSDEIVEKWHSQHIYTTSIFVFLGILRYLQLVFVEERTGSPTRIVLKDRFLQIVIFLWLALFGWFIYG